MHVKPGSKHVIACKGCADPVARGDGWQHDDVTEILGWFIQADTGTCLARTKLEAKLWRCYHGNARRPSFKTLSRLERTQLLTRALLPIFVHAAQIWPPQRGLAMKVNKLQRRMVALALGVFRDPVETFEHFAKRRSREAARFIEQCNGWWTKAWFNRALRWEEHCRRSLFIQHRHFVDSQPVLDLPTQLPWPPLLLDWKGLEFLDERRTYGFRRRDSLSIVSRTRTRRSRGFVYVRWHEGIRDARRLDV